MTSLDDLGFRAPRQKSRIFDRRHPITMLSAGKRNLCYRSGTRSVVPGTTPGYLEITHDCRGAHLDWTNHRFNFTVRVPCANWLPIAGQGTTPYHTEPGAPREPPEVFLAYAYPSTTRYMRPYLKHAHRLFDSLVVTNNDGDEIVRQDGMSIISECDVWLTSETPEPVMCTRGENSSLYSTSEHSSLDSLSTAPSPVFGSYPSVDCCLSTVSQDKLYSPYGLRISMKLSPDLFSPNRGFWPSQGILKFKFKMADAVTALQIDAYPNPGNSDPLQGADNLIVPTQNGRAVPYDDLSTTMRRLVGIRTAPMTEGHRLAIIEPSQSYVYEILDAHIITDSITLAPEAEAVIRQLTESEHGLTIAHTRYSYQESIMGDSSTEYVDTLRLIASNVTDITTIFRRTSIITDGYFDSFDLRNPAIREVGWVVGSDKLYPHEGRLNSPFLIHDHTLASSGFVTSHKRLNEQNFLGDLSYRVTLDLASATSGAGTISYTPSRCFMLKNSFNTDPYASYDTLCGVSSMEDHSIKVKLSRAPSTFTSFVPTLARTYSVPTVFNSYTGQNSSNYRYQGLSAYLQTGVTQVAGFATSLGIADGTIAVASFNTFLSVSAPEVLVPDMRLLPPATFAVISRQAIGRNVTSTTPLEYIAQPGSTLTSYQSYANMEPLMNLRSRFSTGVYNAFAPTKGKGLPLGRTSFSSPFGPNGSFVPLDYGPIHPLRPEIARFGVAHNPLIASELITASSLPTWINGFNKFPVSWIYSSGPNIGLLTVANTHLNTGTQKLNIDFNVYDNTCCAWVGLKLTDFQNTSIGSATAAPASRIFDNVASEDGFDFTQGAGTNVMLNPMARGSTTTKVRPPLAPLNYCYASSDSWTVSTFAKHTAVLVWGRHGRCRVEY